MLALCASLRRLPRKRALLRSRNRRLATASNPILPQTISYSDPFEKYYNNEDYGGIQELQQFQKLMKELRTHSCLKPSSNKWRSLARVDLSAPNWITLFDSALITHILHIQSRVSAFQGKGYYTIGPCGEESMGVVGLLLEKTDCMALHYRHLSAQITRALMATQF